MQSILTKHRNLFGFILFSSVLIAGALLKVYPAGRWQVVPLMFVGLIALKLFSKDEWLFRVAIALPIAGVLLSGKDFIIGDFIIDWKICTTALALIVLFLFRKDITFSNSQRKVLYIAMLPGLMCAAAGSLLVHLQYHLGMGGFLQLLLSLAQALLFLFAVYTLCTHKRLSIILLLLTSACMLLMGRI